MKTICSSLCLCFLLLASCSTQTQPPVQKSSVPEALPVIEASANEVRDSAWKVEASNEALRGQVAKLKSASSEAKSAATVAREEAERLKDLQVASALELENLWKMVQTVETRNLFLETEMDRLLEQAESQAELIRELKVTVDDNKAAAIKKDAEVLALRKAKADDERAIDAANERIKELNAAAVEAASAKSYKAILIWIFGGLLLLAVVFVAIKSLKPV